MSDQAAFFAYALLFRFGIIGAGLYTIFLGYALLKDSSDGDNSAGTASAKASLPGAQIAIKNVTAGSIFSFFGALLVVAMVLQGNPEKTIQTQVRNGNTSETVKLRGDDNDSILKKIQSGIDAQNRGNNTDAEAHFQEALSESSPALNGLAWIYAHEGKVDAALSLSQAAVEIDNSNAHYLDTLAEVEFTKGDKAAALKTMEQAAKLDPQFDARLNELRRRASK